MILVTGPAYSGKQDYICKRLKLTDEEFKKCGIRDVERLVESEEVEALAKRLGEYDIVVMTETGGGVVPTDEGQRLNREKAGRLSCLLAKQADVVVRVVCGLPRLLKGEL